MSSPIPDPIQAGIAAGWQVIDASTLQQDRSFDAEENRGDPGQIAKGAVEHGKQQHH